MGKITVKHIADKLESYAPKNLAESYDNVGLLVGDYKQEVKKVLVGLELTDALLDQGIQEGYDMIVVHHPLIFRPLKAITAEGPIERRVIKLIKSDVSLYAAHTNLDTTIGGLNDFFASQVGINVTNIACGEDIPTVRMGRVEKIKLIEYVALLKEQLGLDVIHYTGDEERMIETVGFCTGSGMSYYMDAVSSGADAFVTGDVKYHDATLADDMDVPIIDITHFGSEIIVGKLFKALLTEEFGDQVEITIGKPYKSPLKSL